MSSSLRRWKGPSSAPARSRPTEGFSAMTRVFGTRDTLAAVRAKPARPGDTWPRAAQPLLSARRRALLAVSARAVPVACPGTGESPRRRRLRPGGEPRLQLRSLAPRAPALAEALPPVHGEIGALLVAA